MKTIVYTSNTGYTKQYAEMLGESLSLDVLSLDDAMVRLSDGDEIIYFGWLMAGFVAGYNKAKKKYKIDSVCAVGMGANGSQIEEIRRSNKISADTPVFVLQGGLDMPRLNPIFRFMMKIVTKSILKDMEAKADRIPDEDNIIDMIKNGGSYVRKENLIPVINFYLSK